MDGKKTEKKENKQQELEFIMDIEEASGKYSNYMRVGHNATEFILDFFMRTDKGIHNSRIIVSPMQIKDFVKTLEKNIKKYEEKHDIELPKGPLEFIEKGIKKGEDMN